LPSTSTPPPNPPTTSVSDNNSLISQPSAPDPDAQIEPDTGDDTDSESVADSAFSSGEGRWILLHLCNSLTTVLTINVTLTV